VVVCAADTASKCRCPLAQWNVADVLTALSLQTSGHSAKSPPQAFGREGATCQERSELRTRRRNAFHCAPRLQMGVEDLPAEASESSLEDEGFLRKFHHALLEVSAPGTPLPC